MQPFLEERLPDSQAGFRKARGCRDNVLILKLLINEVLKAGEEAVVTFIVYTAAFDSVSHRFLYESLAEANVPPKVCRIINAIYTAANGAVRIRQPSGQHVHSPTFSVNRGSIQGDIYSPSLFTLALDRIFRRHDTHCNGVCGPPLHIPPISKLEYADDAALANSNAEEASARLFALATGGATEATLNISLKKTKSMPVRRYERVTEHKRRRLLHSTFPTSALPAQGHLSIRRGSRFTALAGATQIVQYGHNWDLWLTRLSKRQNAKSKLNKCQES